MGPLLAGLQRWPVDVVVSIISRAAPTVCAVTARTCAPSALTRDDHKIRRNGKDLGGESRVRRSLRACGFGARHHRAIAAAMTAEPPAPMATNVHPYRIVDTLT